MSRSILALLIVVSSLSAQPKKDEASKKVDESIKKALKYLASVQNDDGSWGAGLGARGRHPAISGLCVMSFLAAGHVPGEGIYGKNVEKGIRAVIKMQHPNGLFGTEAGHEMYHHGICSLMLAEAIGMTQGPLVPEVKKALEKAVTIILQAQRKTNDANRGGWRYRVAGSDADMSVSGWQILALRAAKNVGCDVPPEAIKEAVEYLKRSQDPGTGAYCYTPHGGPTAPCTGTGILSMCVTTKGASKSPEVTKAGNVLLRSLREPNALPLALHWNSPHFSYCMYYAAQASFQLGGNYWEAFRPVMHKLLLPNQQPNGSWNSSEGYGPQYSTSMGVLALAVEYRFLPIYQRGEEPTDKK